MQKIIKLIMIGFLSFMVTSCGKEDDKPSTTICEATKEGTKKDPKQEITYIYDALGDHIQQVAFTQIITFSPSEDDLEDSNIDEIVKSFKENLKRDYDDVEGTDFSVTSSGDVITVNITIDYTKADLKMLQKKDLISDEGSFVSLQSTIKDTEKEGASCKSE